ncbi:MAG: DUF5317 domain-containing protein [Anaerolineae bacterium]|jgi:hypothetical protein
MILAVAVVLGLLVSLARYKTKAIDRIAALPLRSAWLALLALVLQYPLLLAPFGETQQVVLHQILFLISHLLLLAFVWLNRSMLGIQIIGLGVILNLAAILANSGFMPVSPEALVQINPGTSLGQFPAGLHYGYSKGIILAREETNLWLLSDILILPPPFPWPTAFSLGDLLLGFGVGVLLQGPRNLVRLVAGGQASLLAKGVDGEMPGLGRGRRMQSQSHGGY